MRGEPKENMKKVDVLKPRRLRKQRAWYYLPSGKDLSIDIYCLVGFEDVGVRRVKIPTRKLLRELLASGLSLEDVGVRRVKIPARELLRELLASGVKP